MLKSSGEVEAGVAGEGADRRWGVEVMLIDPLGRAE